MNICAENPPLRKAAKRFVSIAIKGEGGRRVFLAAAALSPSNTTQDIIEGV